MPLLPLRAGGMQEGKDIRFGDWTAKEVEWLNSVQVGRAGRVPYLV